MRKIVLIALLAMTVLIAGCVNKEATERESEIESLIQECKNACKEAI